MADLSEPIALAPGFLVATAGWGGTMFPQLDRPEVRRAQTGVLALVAELTRPPARPLGAVFDEICETTGAEPEVLLRFVTALSEIGALSPTPAPAAHAAQPVPERSGVELESGVELTFDQPLSFLSEDGQFLLFDHSGRLQARLSAAEVHVVTAFVQPRSVADAAKVHRSAQPQVDPEAFDEVVTSLLAAEILRPVTDADRARLDAPPPSMKQPATAKILENVAAAVDAQREETGQRSGHRTAVIPVNISEIGVAPLSLALLMAQAGEHEGGRLRERYDFVPEFLTDEELLAERAREPGIYLFSNYLWNVDRNLAFSALVKQMNPASLTIHGGPSTPKYEGDCEEWFARYDHLDITVRGEGEATFTEILDALDGSLPARLDALQDVAGITYRGAGGGAVRTDDRDRITELDEIPSPYLLGLLDPFGAARVGAIIESNRGCPYGCTFCDWGSSTLSRIRKFSLDRVFAELEWSAIHKIEVASIADANFGVLERDVDIAEKIAELKRTYGYPRTVATNFAKNTVKHLQKIIEVFAEVEILTEGVVALQSMDEPTLKVIRRSNIKLEKYNELTTEFRRARLPLAADIMMGLPGSTLSSFRNDLQQCTNRDVKVRANATQLLPNSPMNAPDYREEFAIVARPGEYVMESSTYTRADWEQMDELRAAYDIFDNWGVLRYVSRFVRQESGLHEVDFLDRFRTDVAADREKWPITAMLLDVIVGYMAPPTSWGLFMDEIHRYLTTELGLADDSALRTALDVQLAHLPAATRTFPETTWLDHDFAAWQEAMLTARESGHRDDWEQVIPRLSTYPPAELVVSDPNDICRQDIGKHMAYLGWRLRSWELHSTIARPRLGKVDASEQMAETPVEVGRAR